MPGLPLLSKPSPSSGSSSIPASSSASSITSQPFGSKSLQRKRPVGLSIAPSIEASRAPPALPLSGSTKDGPSGLSEAEKLRQDIARLQLSSSQSGGDRSPDSGPNSPSTSSPTGQPLTPTTLSHSDSSSSAKVVDKARKKKDGTKKKGKTDKDGLDLVKDEDLEILADLGAGNGGSVTKVWNKKRGCIMARKVS